MPYIHPDSHLFFKPLFISVLLMLASFTFVSTVSSEELGINSKAISIPPSEKNSITLVNEPNDFRRDNLLSPDYRSSVTGFSFLNPNRFSFKQSYSVNFASGGYGTSSNGLYLNTLSYRLADPLLLTVDMGFSTPFYSQVNGMPATSLMQNGPGTSFVIPHIGLSWRPSDRTTLSLGIFNGVDANKAYGNSRLYSPFWHAMEP